MGIRVRAVKVGYYGNQLRQPGTVFEIADMKAFSDSKRERRPGWMELVDPPTPRPPSPPPPPPPPAPVEKPSGGKKGK